MSEPKVLHIVRSARSRKQIKINALVGKEKKSVESDENALAAYQKTLDALKAVVLHVLELPEKYGENLQPVALIMGNKGEADTAEIAFVKHCNWSAKVWRSTTPPAMLQPPTVEGKSSPPLPKKLVELIYDHVEAAKDYFLEKRAQGLLPGMGVGADDKEDDHGGGEGEGDGKQGGLPLGAPGGPDGPPAAPPAAEGKGKPKPPRAPKKPPGTVEKFPGTPGHP